jgi:hypothetical protein
MNAQGITTYIPLIFFALLFLNCNIESSPPPSSSDITLSHYQKLTISPELYKEYLYRDLFEGSIDFNFRKYRIPFIKDGTIRIEEPSSNLIKTLYFEDSLLTKIQGSNRTTQFLYDDERKLISNGVMQFKYVNGKLASKERDLTIHTFQWKGDCVLWEAKDKDNAYISNSELCYNQNGKIIKDYSSFPVGDKSITEEFQVQYALDTIISNTYVRTENKDTTTHHLVSYEINNLGLLAKTSTKIVNEDKTYLQEYKYEVLNAQPLIVSKFEMVDEQKKKEIRYTFNAKGQLVEFEQMGKYGEKYKVIYDEK